jgi:hypothetical protein
MLHTYFLKRNKNILLLIYSDTGFDTLIIEETSNQEYSISIGFILRAYLLTINCVNRVYK